MEIMFDSVSAAKIPLCAEVVAGYLDGAYAWTDADWSRFPGRRHVGIVVTASANAGQVLDVEKGDATPDQAPGWVTRRRAARVDPVVYTSASNVHAVLDAFVAQKVSLPLLWVASWDGLPCWNLGLGHNVVAKQFLAGPDFDLSIVGNHWPA